MREEDGGPSNKHVVVEIVAVVVDGDIDTTGAGTAVPKGGPSRLDNVRLRRGWFEKNASEVKSLVAAESKRTTTTMVGDEQRGEILMVGTR